MTGASKPDRRVYRDIVRRLDGRSIVLVGIMGAGKTAIGRRLADRLHLPFTDADQEIETAANMTIPEIFESHGETYFRDGERRVIARLLGERAQVLSTGGGAFMNDETRKRIKQDAVSIWLHAELEILMERVRRKSNRPLLKSADPDQVMRDLLATRNPVYAEADLAVESFDGPHDAVVDQVVIALDQHLDTAIGASAMGSAR
ncbi:MAG: shikimate kinase [Pseudomonadota bacterium]